MNVAYILTDLNDHGFTDTSDSRKMAVINETYQDVCGREPWPFLETTVSLNYDGTGGTATNHPSDFRAATKLYRTLDGLPLLPWRMDDFFDTFGDNLTLVSSPQIYFFEAVVPKVYPVPGVGDGQVVMKYLRVPADLSATDLEGAIALPARYHRGTLLNGAAEKLYAMEDDTDLATWFERKYEKAIDKMRRDLWSQQFDTPDYIHRVDTDDLSASLF